MITSDSQHGSLTLHAIGAPKDATPRRRPRILLADDDAAVRDSLALVLRTENYEVIQARDGKEAVYYFQQYAPDLVLLDLNMPRQNGWSAFEAMETLRPFTPCIVITAKAHQENCAAGHGVDVLMEKPLDIGQLLDVIHQLLTETYEEHLTRITRSDFRTVCINANRPKRTR